MEQRRFKISGAGWTGITAYEGALKNDSIILTYLKGWDEQDHIEVETTPKLFGSGSYITSKRLTERVITARFFFGHELSDGSHATGGSIRERIVLPAQMAAESLAEVTLSRTWLTTATASAYRTEALKGYITSVGAVVFHADGSAEIEFEVLCPNPVKSIT